MQRCVTRSDRRAAGRSRWRLQSWFVQNECLWKASTLVSQNLSGTVSTQVSSAGFVRSTKGVLKTLTQMDSGAWARSSLRNRPGKRHGRLSSFESCLQTCPECPVRRWYSQVSCRATYDLLPAKVARHRSPSHLSWRPRSKKGMEGLAIENQLTLTSPESSTKSAAECPAAAGRRAASGAYGGRIDGSSAPSKRK